MNSKVSFEMSKTLQNSMRMSWLVDRETICLVSIFLVPNIVSALGECLNLSLGTSNPSC